MNPRNALLAGAILSLSLVVIGAVILAFFSAPTEKSEVTTSNSLTVKANDYTTQFFGYYSVNDNVASFNVLNGTIQSCEPLTEAHYLEWEAGRYVPNLTETDQGIFEYEGTHFQYPLIGPIYGRYFFFFNQDSHDKVIQWRVTSYWQEANTTNLTIGAVLMTAGLGVALGLALMHLLKTNPRSTISHSAQSKDVRQLQSFPQTSHSP